MQDERKTRQQLIKELAQLRRRVTKLERARRAEPQRIEAAVRESQSTLSTILNSSSQFFILVDFNANILAFNTAATRVWQAAFGQEIKTGRSIFDYLLKEQPEEYARIASTIIDGQDVVIEKCFKGIDGLDHWFELHLDPARSADGQHVGVLCGATDITSRKQIEIVLRQSEESYRRLVEISPAPILVHVKGTIVFANQATLDLLGASTADDLLNRPFLQIVHPDFHAMVKHRVQLIDSGESVPSVDQKLIGLDGRVIDITAIGSRCIYRGQPAIQVVLTDVTEQRRAEEVLRQRSNDLSALNAELARAVRMKDEFLANVSHELRTPLNAILGLSETLQEQVYGPLNERQAKTVGRIEESGQHLLALINDILDLSKIEAGKSELEISAVSADSICQASLRLIKELADKKQIKIQSHIDRAVTTIQVDGRRLKQILVNLLNNAVKFTLPGGEIGLEVHGEAEAQIVRFVVWDTGIGIAREDMPLLFKPFVQLNSSLERQNPGTGLGLSLVERLVDMHGGSVAMESEPGKGSRFTVSLRWQTEGQASASLFDSSPVPASTGAKKRAATQSITPPLILLAEDNESNVRMVSDYLQAKGCRLIVARNGREAIERAREYQPDLILMDVQMPELDGLEATRQIRLLTGLTDIPIIALTAVAMPGDRERCLAAGANDYLSKPISLKILMAAIETQLNRTQGTDSR